MKRLFPVLIAVCILAEICGYADSLPDYVKEKNYPEDIFSEDELQN